MIAAESLQNQSAIAGIVLVVSGFVSLTMRRHLIQGLLGFYLSLLGAVMLVAGNSPTSSGWTAVVIIVSALLFFPVGLAAFARWRAVAGSANRSTLQEKSQDDRGV